MPQVESDFMQKARRVRDDLIAQYMDNPAVVLIDIGTPPDTDSKNTTNEIVVRVHVREYRDKTGQAERLDIPGEIDGVRVIVIPGDYRLE